MDNKTKHLNFLKLIFLNKHRAETSLLGRTLFTAPPSYGDRIHSLSPSSASRDVQSGDRPWAAILSMISQHLTTLARWWRELGGYRRPVQPSDRSASGRLQVRPPGSAPGRPSLTAELENREPTGALDDPLASPQRRRYLASLPDPCRAA